MVARMTFKNGPFRLIYNSKSYPAVMNITASSHGIQRPSQGQVWYCQAGTADSSCCQQSFFSGPNLYRSPADPSRQQNHLQGEMTAEQTALWCCSGWNPNVRALNLVFPSVSSLSQCLLVFPSVLWSLPASLVNPSRINMKSVAEVAILVRLKDSYDHQTVRSSGFIRSIKPGILLKSQVSSFLKKTGNKVYCLPQGHPQGASG